MAFYPCYTCAVNTSAKVHHYEEVIIRITFDNQKIFVTNDRIRLCHQCWKTIHKKPRSKKDMYITS